LDPKLILLKEIATIGYKKEIAFLNHLQNSLDGKLLKQVKKSLDIIFEKYEDEPDQLISEKRPTKIPESIEEPETGKIPMELFLLYEEMGIETSNKEDSIIPDFVLYESPQPLKSIGNG